MKPKTKSELMAEWANQPDQLKREREVKAIRKAMDDARAVMQDGLTRYVKKKTKARSMAKAEADPFAELEGWESMEQIQDAYGYGEITADRRDKLTGEKIEGPKVTVKMAKDSGWWNKNGSYWPKMTEMMLKYRAAAYFARAECPEVLMGANIDYEVGAGDAEEEGAAHA